MVLLSEAAAALRERDAATQLYTLLLPYRRSAIVVGLAAVCAGSACHVLGLLASVIGNLADARRHFEHALEMNGALEAPTLLARTQAEYGWKLQEWGRKDDADRAAELLSEARQTAERLGMRGLLGPLSG